MDALKNKTRDKVQFITLAVFLLIPTIAQLLDNSDDYYYRSTSSMIEETVLAVVGFEATP